MPADIGSHVMSATELKDNELWWTGPKWLKGPSENYPPQFTLKELGSDERFAESAKEQVTNFQVNIDEVHGIDLDKIIDIAWYSSCNRLLRVTVLVLRFVSNLICRIRGKNGLIKSEGLTKEEIEQAESMWIKTAQRSVKEAKNFAQLQKQLGLYVESDGIIRCRGHIGNAALKFEARFPAILTDHPLASLVIEQAHERVLHNGLKSTLNEGRSRVWITRARQHVRKFIHNCTTYRRFESLPYKYPTPPHLPEFRVDKGEAFSSVGTDLAGPLYVRNSQKDTNTHKVWIVIFTCTLSRGVHLEIMEDMSVEQFILALRRFISRRGCPQRIVSDNAKTFKGANKLLQNLFKDEEVKKFLVMKRIEWINILSKAPWYGGVYERLIKSVKRCLKKTLRNAKVTSTELYTLVVEIDGTLNNRPLTYLSADEFDKTLTPNHLICGRRLEQLPHLNINHCTEEDLSPDNLNSRQQYLAKLLRHWWNRWKHEYLVDLHEISLFCHLAIVENHVSRKGTLSQFIKTKCPEDFGDLERLRRLFKVKIKTFGVPQ